MTDYVTKEDFLKHWSTIETRMHKSILDSYTLLEHRLDALFAQIPEEIQARIDAKLASPRDSSSAHSPHHPLHDQDETDSPLSPSFETRQNSIPETLVRNSNYQFPLSDRTRFVWFDIEQAQDLLHVRVEEYS